MSDNHPSSSTIGSPRIVFMGTPEFAVASLDALVDAGYNIVAVITAPDKPAGRGMQLTESAVKKYAKEKGLQILQPEKLKNPEFLEQLRSLKADLQVVVAFRMLPGLVWNMPPMGTINLHGSLLPQYRGAAPINWAVINGEKETGVTTFKLQQDIDTGNILLQERFPIGDQDTAGDVHDRMKEIGARLLVRTVRGLVSGDLTEKPQDQLTNSTPETQHSTPELQHPTPGTQPPPPVTQPPTSVTQPPTSGTQPPTPGIQPPTPGTQPPTSGTQPPPPGTQPPTSGTQPPPPVTQHPTSGIQQNNVPLKHAPKIFTETCKINWNKPVADVYNLIRGLSPFPTAFTYLDGKLLKIYRAEKETAPPGITPGEFETDKKTYLKFAGPDGYIKLEEIQLEGKKKMKIEDFLRGYKPSH
jgi:methionyl-tRNA formyltransferase